MKKIAIVSKCMVIGGIEKALIEMLRAFDRNKYEITLYLMELGGEFYDEIPSWVNIKLIPNIEFSTLEHIKYDLKQKEVLSAINKFGLLIQNRFEKRYYKECENLSKVLPIQDEVYDLVISYYTPVSLPIYYCLYNLKSKKKIAFIHNGVDDLGTDISPCYKDYEKYDKIFAVSLDAKQEFINKFPKLASKTEIFFNIMNELDINKKASRGEVFKRENNEVIILTVGRLTYAKGHDIIPRISYKLKEKGYKFKWYIIGEGPLRKQLESEIKELNLKNNVILLGGKKNPYGYFKTCDIYAQVSRQEGFGITVAEAKYFNKPIIATEFTGIHDQINNDKNGLIVSFKESEIEAGIESLMTNKQLADSFSNRLKNEKFNNLNQMNMIYEMLI